MRSRTPEKRNALLDAALAVFLEDGFAGATITDIGLRAAASKQTLYNYFPDKTDLFQAVVRREIGSHIEPLFGPFDTAAPGDIGQQLLRFGMAYVAVRNTEKALALRRMFLADGHRHGLGATLFESGPRQGWMRLAAYLDRAVEQGILRSTDTWRATMLFQGLCESGPLQRRLEGALESYPDGEISVVVTEAVDVFLRAYGREKIFPESAPRSRA